MDARGVPLVLTNDPKPTMAVVNRLLKEVRWIARFDVDSCVSVLERVCPDHRGLHVNLYDLLQPHKEVLVPADA